MIIGRLIWNTQTILLVIFLGIATIFCFVWAWCFATSIEKGVDWLMNDDDDNLSDEISIEIVQEKPSCPSGPQTEPSPLLSKAEEPQADSSSHPRAKGAYIPE